jgi:deoxycytidylate deaminase
MKNIEIELPPRKREYNVIDDLRDHRYFRLIVDILQNHPHQNELLAIHAAVLVKGCQVISIGYNKPYKPAIVRSIAPHPNLSMHAEIDAIHHAKKHDLRDAKMFVARVQKNKSTIAMSRPCHICQMVMHQRGVNKSVYTTYHGFLGQLKIKQPYIKINAFDFETAA